MKRTNSGVLRAIPLAAAIAFIGLAGCEPVVYDDRPDWDGGIGWDVGFDGHGDHDRDRGRDHDHGAFHHDGGERAGDRGHASLGGHPGGSGGFHGGGGESHGGGGGGGGGHR